MRAKVVTSAFLITGVVLLLAWPWIVGTRPPLTAPRGELRDYLIRLSVYVCILLTVFFCSALGAYFVVRQQRREFRDQAHQNLKELIEGTLDDHAKKQPDV